VAGRIEVSADALGGAGMNGQAVSPAAFADDPEESIVACSFVPLSIPILLFGVAVE
jgi:hypothetical protein